MSSRHGLFVCNTYYPESAGVGNATGHLCKALREFTDIRPHVIVPRRTPSPRREKHEGTHIFRVPAGHWARHPVLSFFFYPLFGLCFFRELLRIRPHFVLFQTAWEGGCLIPLIRLSRLKTMTMVHTHANVRYASRFESWARMAYREADVVLATTSQYLGDLRELYGCSDAIVMPNAYYRPEVQGGGAACSGNDQPPDGFHVVSVGRMVYEKDSETKGISYLIRAVAEVPGVILHMFGDGPNRRDYELLAESLGISRRCLFHGHVAPQILLERMRACNALVMSSLHEGLSMTLLEAMSTGLPVISTDTAGARDHIHNRQNGLLVDAGSVSAMTGALQYAKTHRNRMVRMGAEAMRTYQERFSPHVVAARFARLIDRRCPKLAPGVMSVPEAA